MAGKKREDETLPELRVTVPTTPPTPGSNYTFAPPLPAVLPEVRVTPRPAPPPPKVRVTPSPMLLPVLPVVAIVTAGIGLVAEMFRKRDVEAEKPVKIPKLPTITPAPRDLELELLPEIIVTPPRTPTLPPAATAGDPFPFDLDPLEWYPDVTLRQPFVPFFDDPEPRQPARRTRPVRKPAARPVGDPDLVPDTGLPGDAPDWLEVDLRPAADPRPTPGDQPLGDPRPQPAPSADPRPDTGIPEPFAIPNPVETPTRTPTRSPTRTPTRSPTRRPVPTPFSTPFDAPLQTPTLAEPPRVKDRDCTCEEPRKQKKDKKDRKVCYRGTYIERPRSLTKVRREQVSCSTGQPLR